MALQLFLVVWIFLRSLAVIMYSTTHESSVRFTQVISRICVSWTHSLPFQFLPLFWLNEITILSKARKTDNFESHNSLEVSFTNMRGLYLNFVECESFSESNFPDILALDETNLNWLWHTYAMVMVMVIMVMLLNCMVLQFIWTRGFFLHGTYL